MAFSGRYQKVIFSISEKSLFQVTTKVIFSVSEKLLFQEATKTRIFPFP